MGCKSLKASWVRLNTDGATKGNSGPTSVRGLLRDDTGQWLGGFVKFIGMAISVWTELWAVKFRLELALDLGHLRVILEVDSEVVACVLVSRRGHIGWNDVIIPDTGGLLERN